MGNDLQNLAGASWLAETYRLPLVTPLPVVSRIGGRRASPGDHLHGTEIYPDNMRPDGTLPAHLTFHLKHETPQLELLARLFDVCDPGELAGWITHEPTGQYARRAGFLYEFLTGRKLSAKDAPGGAYVDALPADRLVTASPEQTALDRRWRIRDNMPGTRHFCPMLQRTTAVEAAMALDVAALVATLGMEFGADSLMRSAVWLTMRESRSSFAIEGEADAKSRIARFADVLARRTGMGDCPLNDVGLAALQADILGRQTSLNHFGLRLSPVFVGETAHDQEIVHYIAPPSTDVEAMLNGLRVFLERTHGQSPVMRAAVASFGFVYIHPLADGNGRVHRFLINDILRRDGVIHPPMILPVSARIADHTERLAYDRVLDSISRPLMSLLTGHYDFSPTRTRHPDGVFSNLVFAEDALARPTWRFPDFSAHAVWLAGALERTVRIDMREESLFLRRHARAREAIKEIVEMPDTQIDRVIRSCQNNDGKLSHVLAKEIPILQENGVWEAIVAALHRAEVTHILADLPPPDSR
jgi:hypothetical protein